jgi:hypothetical protein
MRLTASFFAVSRALALPAALAVALASARPASAQLIGANAVNLGSLGAPVQGMDSGYDPNTGFHLVVSAYLNAWGWYVNSEGQTVAGPFLIKSGGGGAFAPRVKYSPNVNGGQGGFLLVYSEEAGGGNILRARTISYPGVVGPETTISDGSAPPWLISGASAVSYGSGVFLVSWMSTGAGARLVARAVSVSGAPASAITTISQDVGLYPGVAYNPSTNHFAVSYRDEGSAGYAGIAIVSPQAAVLAKQRFQPVVGQQGATDIDFNPDTGRFVMAWFAQPSGGPWEVRAAEIDSGGGVVSSGLLFSTSGGVGFSSLSVAFNPVSRTFLAGTLQTVGLLDPVLGLELNRGGYRFDTNHVVGGILARNLRVSTHGSSARWNVAFNHNTQTPLNAIVRTSSSGGGPAGSLGSGGGGSTPPPSSPPPPSGGCTTVQPAPDWVCVNGGWLPPGMGGVPAPPPPAPAPPPPSSSCTTVQPGPGWGCLNGNWLPPGMGGAPAPAPPPPTAPPPPSSTCSTVRPASDWVCVSGNWLPPGLAPATPAPWIPPPSSSSACPTVQPGPDWICTGGNWIPLAMACPSIQPGPGWTCRNGDWLPPGMGANRLTVPALFDRPGFAPKAHAVAVVATARETAAPARGRI